jgi:hypothetical protein
MQTTSRRRQAIRMAQPEDPQGFDHWLAAVYAPEGVPDDELNAPTRQWLRDFFDLEGPVPAERAWEAFLAYQVALATEASTAVVDDLQRTTPLRLVVAVEDNDGSGVRISINGGWTAPSMWELQRPKAFVEVAEYFRDQLWDEGCWPVCEQHGIGLRGAVHDGVAVWWCRVGAHALARIGELDP